MAEIWRKVNFEPHTHAHKHTKQKTYVKGDVGEVGIWQKSSREESHIDELHDLQNRSSLFNFLARG